MMNCANLSFSFCGFNTSCVKYNVDLFEWIALQFGFAIHLLQIELVTDIY